MIASQAKRCVLKACQVANRKAPTTSMEINAGETKMGAEQVYACQRHAGQIAVFE
ncbi:MAG: hypothetical protein U1F77_19075 [Kiritimatiellia bacterium]